MKKNVYIGIIVLFVSSLITMSFNLKEPPTKNPNYPYKKMTNVKIGDMAPELAFTNPSGKMLKLSSLKGKYVLIDFWASWCGPCRRENPNLVNVYEKYSKAKFKNGKGFEIFSYSLDNNKNKWVSAIKQDKLKWDYHVSDLKGWSAAGARTYGINSIPSSFLIDPSGKIIAKSLRGIQLHKVLDQYVESF